MTSTVLLFLYPVFGFDVDSDRLFMFYLYSFLDMYSTLPSSQQIFRPFSWQEPWQQSNCRLTYILASFLASPDGDLDMNSGGPSGNFQKKGIWSHIFHVMCSLILTFALANFVWHNFWSKFWHLTLQMFIFGPSLTNLLACLFQAWYRVGALRATQSPQFIEAEARHRSSSLT